MNNSVLRAVLQSVRSNSHLDDTLQIRLQFCCVFLVHLFHSHCCFSCDGGSYSSLTNAINSLKPFSSAKLYGGIPPVTSFIFRRLIFFALVSSQWCVLTGRAKDVMRGCLLAVCAGFSLCFKCMWWSIELVFLWYASLNPFFLHCTSSFSSKYFQRHSSWSWLTWCM